MKRKIQKLRQITLDELRVRGSQSLSALAERKNWSRQTQLPSEDAIQELFDRDKFGQRAAFFASFDDRVATINELRRRWPNAEAALVERAERIVAGRFDLLAFRDLSFGTPLDWHLEPVAGKRAPLVHWSRLDYLDADLFGDKKIVWELNRHQYFVTLGQAYWLTGDERYAETFMAHVNSWMDHNPPKLGVNWASSLEVSFRSISWLWALYFFKHAAALTPSKFVRLCQFLYLNARHLETYLSTYFSPNTHLTGEALGLFYLGTLLPEFPESSRWRNTGLQILLEQLPRHVRPDGVYFEQSSYYHRYTADFYLHLRVLLARNDDSIPPELDEKLRLLLDHLMYIARPDGTTPLFGDDDGGRLTTLSQPASNDFRATLATGAAIFERPDYKFVASGPAQDTLWLLGPEGVARLDGVAAIAPETQSVAFRDGGYYVMRDGWTRDANYLLFDCGPHGTDNCGHAHADALSFELAFKGTTVLVDPGTYTYTGSKEMRDWFRSTHAHNTVTIDGQSSSVADGPFSWQTTARSECSRWITDERFDYLAASHDGFARLQSPATHMRSVLFIKNDYWILRDVVESAGEHEVRAWFHLDQRVQVSRLEKSMVCMTNGLQIAAFGPDLDLKEERGWVSQCYGEKTEAAVLSFTVLANGSVELVTFLVPEAARVTDIEAISGRAFVIEREGRRDVLMLRDSDAKQVEMARLVSDFAVTWVRFEPENPQAPAEVIVIDGQTLRFEGRDILQLPERVSHRSGRMADAVK